MSPVKLIRIAGEVLFIGVVGFVTYVYLSVRALMSELNEDEPDGWYNEGVGYFTGDTSELHLRDMYYVVFHPWLVFLLVILTAISIFCLIAPSRVVSIFRR